MREFRQIQSFAFRFRCRVEIAWVRGETNVLADALSRLDEPGQWKRARESASPPLLETPEHYRPPPSLDY